jgi:hypothetical protein
VNDYGNGQPPPSYPQPYGYPPQGYGQPQQPQPYPMQHVQPHAYAAPAPVPGQSDYKNAGMLMLVSGIKSALISLGLFFGLIWVCVGAFWLLTFVGAVAEIIMGAMILSGTRTPNAKVVSIFGIVNAVLCLNVIGIALEAIALSQLNKPQVAHYAATGP